LAGSFGFVVEPGGCWFRWQPAWPWPGLALALALATGPGLALALALAWPGPWPDLAPQPDLTLP
jgi:hypothetical protein